MLRETWGMLRESVMAGAGVAATTAGGSWVAAPPWLIAVGQAAIVVAFTVKAIDRRLARFDAGLTETKAEVATLRGRLNACPCQPPTSKTGGKQCGPTSSQPEK